MLNLTTEIKSRCFKEHEKSMLYKLLRKPIREKKEVLRENFRNYLENNIYEDVLDPELVLLGEKPYCNRPINRFKISPTKLGLDEYYVGLPSIKNCKTSLVFEDYSSKYRVSCISGSYSIDITDDIIKKCSEEKIEQVKYFLYECAKADFDDSFFGIGTFIKSGSGYSCYGLFPTCATWGNLYSKNPEYFKLLYEIVGGKKLEEETDTEPEKKLLEELKIALGY